MTTSTTIVKAVETAVVAAAPVAAPVKAKAPTKAKADKAVAAVKPAAKKATAVKGKSAPKAAIGIKFCLIDRPVSGGNLYAFTQAVLNASGLAAGKGASKAMLTTVMGATAVRYHLNKTTFATNDKGLIVLSAAGKHSFGERVAKGQVDASLVEGYEQLFRDGKANANLPMGKNQVMIRAVA
jgi:hypothetical protein